MLTVSCHRLEVFWPNLFFCAGLWHTVSAPAAARANLGLVSARDKVYAVGGGGPNHQLASIEIYDPSVDRHVRH